jgi:hypothetical protein
MSSSSSSSSSRSPSAFSSPCPQELSSSLRCQVDGQASGLSRQASIQACISFIEEYKKCAAREKIQQRLNYGLK